MSKYSNQKHITKKMDHHNDIPLKEIDEGIREFILKKNPQLTESSKMTLDNLLKWRLEYIKEVIYSDSKKMEQLNLQIVETVKNDQTISSNVNATIEKKLTLGQKTADAIAKFGGSWPFIFIFISILVIWILLNSVPLFFKPFDSYPFILLNLALSCLAAIQAPVIMMSQNRQTQRDREEANNDYQVNLKSEIEVNLLHEKMDYLINNQWQHLVEIQNMQIELLGELQKQVEDLSK